MASLTNTATNLLHVLTKHLAKNIAVLNPLGQRPLLLSKHVQNTLQEGVDERCSREDAAGGMSGILGGGAKPRDKQICRVPTDNSHQALAAAIPVHEAGGGVRHASPC
eukprot:5073778-Pyramimonas_sp.AAC.1